MVWSADVGGHGGRAGGKPSPPGGTPGGQAGGAAAACVGGGGSPNPGLVVAAPQQTPRGTRPTHRRGAAGGDRHPGRGAPVNVADLKAELVRRRRNILRR